MLLFMVPAFLQDKLDLTIPPVFQAIIFAFMFAADDPQESGLAE